VSDGSLLAPELELYTHSRPEPYRGVDGLRTFLGEIHGGFPDARFTLDRIVAENRTAVLRWSMSATNSGRLFGFPPTNRPVALTALELLRLDDDHRLREVRLVLDPLSVLRQVGLAPQRLRGPLRWLIHRRLGGGAA
jgi:predicted ester cyclase